MAATMELLMNGERAHVIFTDPPYNVPIDGHVSGLGCIRHREFAMGSGEMTSEAFTGFLKETLGNAAAVARDGTIAFVCMDWRHIGELLAAGEQVFSSSRIYAYGTRPTVAWGRSIEASTNWCLCSK
jgi:hypothetical protein